MAVIWDGARCGRPSVLRWTPLRLQRVPVDQLIHLQDGFRFRFRNHGALGGNVDLWHIDYVLLDDNIDPDNLGLFRGGVYRPRYTFTEPYSIMPWSHFLTDPAVFMRDSMQTSTAT